MHIIFIRHAKTDYTIADERKAGYYEMNFSPIDREAIPIVARLANNPILHNCELILSSPYTRALQTAEIINRQLQLPLFVEFDLHEWRVDIRGQYISETEVMLRYREFQALKGIYPAGKKRDWEELAPVKQRALTVLKQYAHYRKILVVTHGVLIQSVIGEFYDIPNCGIAEYDIQP